MFLSIHAFGLAALLPILASTTPTLTPGTGHARVKNRCSKNIYLHSADSAIGPEYTLLPNAEYVETYSVDPRIGDGVLKATLLNDGLFVAGAPQAIMSYLLRPEDGTVWYSLAQVYGDLGVGFAIETSDETCKGIGEPKVTNEPPKGEFCGAHGDITLVFCA
jgi:hypothetical protein